MSEDRFFERWSRRKRGAREAPPVEAAEGAPAGSEVPVAPEPENEPTAEEIAALPPVESVIDAAGLRPFLRRGIPAALRHTALRRLWRLDPKIRDHVDAAQDYAFDWNAPGGVPGGGGIVTREQVAEILDRLFPPARPPEEPNPDVAGIPLVEAAGIPATETTGETAVDRACPPLESVARDATETRAAPRGPRGRHGGATPS